MEGNLGRQGRKGIWEGMQRGWGIGGSCGVRRDGKGRVEGAEKWCYGVATTYYLLPTTYYLLPTIYYLLPTIYYLLPTTYYLLPTYVGLFC